MWIEVQIDKDQRWLMNFDQVRTVRRQYEGPGSVIEFEGGHTIAVAAEYTTLLAILSAR
ncbi:hypothetical protein [Mesorhizobium ventifaucium]|uniref:Uncharacterized protein n=1 Tax=Mesorhizobium ventifaucium TaxID=666020 RepID=A0ABM9DR93_9HYPH|nr:hypothetical protein [Mesorhizobium ventifaucium]CAH2399196.1 hypothetical protein MES4922_210145 [Mesorhizobium ventifaucium]